MDAKRPRRSAKALRPRGGGACSGGGGGALGRGRAQHAALALAEGSQRSSARHGARNGAQHGAQHDDAAAAEELMFREALEQSLLWGKAEEEAREEGLVPDFLRYET